MNRRAIPEFEMSKSGQEHLRRQGILAMPFMDSLTLDPQRLQPHYHGFFQMFLLQGEATVMHDFEEFTTREGSTVVFLSPGQVHSAKPGKGLRGTTISFTQEFFDDSAPPPSKLFDFPFFFPAEAKPWLVIPKGDSHRVAESFTELQSEFEAGLDDAAEILRAMLHILLVRVNRLYAELHPQRDFTRGAQIARQFHLAVEQRFREDHALAPYARALGVTPNYLNDVVQEHTGHAAGETIRRRRLLDAKRLLSHSDLSVSEIGYHLGFQDPSYFSRFFRRYAGNTPAEFRKEIREKYHSNPE